jgi:mono/diheme cytochrome c family protein
MNFLKAVFILSALVIFLNACGEPAKNAVDNAANTTAAHGSNSAAPAPSPAATADELAATREIYTISCSNCHKEDGTGGKVEILGKTIDPDDLTTDKMKKMSDEKYIKYIENGIPDEGMPAFKGKLTDQQIKDVVRYIRVELQK